MSKQKPKPPGDSQPAEEVLPGVPTAAEAATDVDTPAAAEPVADVTTADEPAAEPAAEVDPSPPPSEPAVPCEHRISLVTRQPIAMGNGTRDKGYCLGVFITAIGVSIAEALALAASYDAECCCCEPADEGLVPLVTRGAAVVAERAFPPGSHVGNFKLTKDTLRSEGLFALRNHSVVCS